MTNDYLLIICGFAIADIFIVLLVLTIKQEWNLIKRLDKEYNQDIAKQAAATR